MCGLAGFSIGARAQSDKVSILEKMLYRIKARGPDDQGVWFDDEMALGHRRLSIVDLSEAGHQPMLSRCGRYVIAFNGEIYNHRAIRKALDGSREVIWSGHSDTEVMLEAILQWGLDRALEEFNGMFAFALWDRENSILTLARDRLGEKPLYYSNTDHGVLFGSELTALEVFPGFDREIDRNALGQYFRSRYFPAPLTIYKAVSKLKPAHYIQWHSERGVFHEKCYWDLALVASKGQSSLNFGSESEILDELELLLLDSVELRMEADVPLGAFLSGGVDSSLVVALMQSKASQAVRTFSMGFDVPGYNEAEHAKAVANYLGTRHTEQYVSGRDALAVVPDMGRIYDEPFADSSQIPTFLVNRMAREHVSVCLSGDGGDELFGGYERYEVVPAIWSKVSKVPMRKFVAALLERAPLSFLNFIAQAASPLSRKYMRSELTGERLQSLVPWLQSDNAYDFYRQSMAAWKVSGELVIGEDESYKLMDNVAPSFDDFRHRMMFHDMATYLPGDILTKVDRASMSVSLEGRIPLLDHRLAEFSWQLPSEFKYRNGVGKWPLRQILYRHVPQHMIDRPKKGFGVPLAEWLRSDLREWAEALLDVQALQDQGLLDVNKVRLLWDYHIRERGDFSVQLWPILMLQAWLWERDYS